jgi:hypothetical protein
MSKFEDSWVVIWELKKTLNAATYQTRDTNEKFASGRPKLEIKFYNVESKLITTRVSMELTSKGGNRYLVCSKHEAAPQRTILKRECSNDYDVLAQLNEDYASK